MDLALGADEQRRADLDDQPRAGAGGEAVGFILQARPPSLRTTGASKRRPFARLLSLVLVGHGVGRGAEPLHQLVEHPVDTGAAAARDGTDRRAPGRPEGRRAWEEEDREWGYR